MGGSSSKHHSRNQGAGNGRSAPQQAAKKGTTLARSSAAQRVVTIIPASLNAEAPAPLQSVPQEQFDVAISATREDGALAEFIKGERACGLWWSGNGVGGMVV